MLMSIERLDSLLRLIQLGRTISRAVSHHFGQAVWRGVLTMKRFFLAAVALAFVAGLALQPAQAQAQQQAYGWNGWNSFWAWWSHGRDPRLTAVSMGVGAASTVASLAATRHHQGHFGNGVFISAWAVTSGLCAVVYPMVGTVVLNRPLTPREAYVGMADCVVPFVGGWLVDAALPHDAWTDGLPPTARRR
jgi:hypothetical protein